jgi:hypothetical protein
MRERGKVTASLLKDIPMPERPTKSITLAAGPVAIKSNSFRHSLSMKPLRLKLVLAGTRTRQRAIRRQLWVHALVVWIAAEHLDRWT